MTMSSGERELSERERRDADRRYNDALTSLDRAVVDASALGGVGSALMVFLQQITPFVDTRDRAIAAEAGARVAGVESALAALDELRARLAIVQRKVEALGRSGAAAAPQSAVNPQPALRTPQSADVTYVAFEDEFRGSDAEIAERLAGYIPIFKGRSNVLDIGCGRGEFLAALRDAGVAASGVDANAEMAAVARDRGLAAAHGDALAHVTALPDGSLGGAVATQVVEHLEPPYLTSLLAALAQKLTPGAPVVIETINPACWLAFFSSYIRDLTHVRPVHPDTLQYLLRAHGFERVEIRYSAPVPEQIRMRSIDLPADVLTSTDSTAAALVRVAHTINANAAILNSLMFSHLDYAAVGYRT